MLATVLGVGLNELIPTDLTESIPTGLAPEPAVLHAKTLYENLTASQQHIIQIQQQRIEQLEAENQRLQDQLTQLSGKAAGNLLFFISPVGFIGKLIEIIGFPILDY